MAVEPINLLAPKNSHHIVFLPLLTLLVSSYKPFSRQRSRTTYFNHKEHTYNFNPDNTVDSICLRRSLCCKDLLKGMWKRIPFSTGQPNEYFNRLSTLLSLRLLPSIPPEHSKLFTSQNQVALLGPRG